MKLFPGLRKYWDNVTEEANAILSGKQAIEANKPIETTADHLAAVGRTAHKRALNRRIDGMNEARIKRGEKPLFEMDEVTEDYSNWQRAQSLFYNGEGKVAKGRIAGLVGGAYATDRIFFDD